MKVTREAWKGFGLLAGINLGVALLPFACEWLSIAGTVSWFVIVFFPVLHWAWSLPLLLVAHHRGREEYASGLLVAAALSSLLGGACWVVAVASI